MKDSKNHNNIRISAKREGILANYAKAAVFLYGILSIPELVEVFNHYEAHKTYEQEAISGLLSHEKSNPDSCEYQVFKNLLISSTFFLKVRKEDKAALYAIREEQRKNPRFLPSKADFIKFSDPLYIEPYEPFEELLAYIIENGIYETDIKDDIDDVRSDLLDLHELFQQEGCNVGWLLDFFLEREYSFKDTDMTNDFLQVVVKAHNNTRKFSINGHTPTELFEIFNKNKSEKPSFTLSKKVGRNESCPCGSGRKFKKCCSFAESTGASTLSRDKRLAFFSLWYILLEYVNRNLRLGLDIDIRRELPKMEVVMMLRKRLWEEPSLISRFIGDAGSYHEITPEGIRILESWENHHLKETFLVVKYTAKHAVLMPIESEKDPVFYGVVGLESSIAEVLNYKVNTMIEAVLLPYGTHRIRGLSKL